MQAEIITIGTELLLGQIVDTNAAFLARKLAEIGFNVFRKTTVGDNTARIAESMQSALSCCDVVIASGGLGPTVDDKTREAAAAATGRDLILEPELLLDIQRFFNQRGSPLSENNKRQAYLPRGATAIRNPVGTAPAFIVPVRKKFLICLPGVPAELNYLTENAVMRFLQEEFRIQTIIKTRTLKTAGMGESAIDRQIGDLEESTNPTVGLAAHLGSVDIRISAKANSPDDARAMLDQMETRIRQRLGEMIYGTDDDTIEGVVVQEIRQRRLKLALLETNTGGELSARLTSAPGGYEVVDQATVMSLKRAGFFFAGKHARDNWNVSEKTAISLSRALQQKHDVPIGIAVVGDEDAGMGPYSDPTGNTYAGLALGSDVICKHIPMGGLSRTSRSRIINATLDKLRRSLKGLDL
ncbi:MAG: CinA family nicotinamide mononucleotide deamidase-related protein [Desulfobacterales bacterium]|nr:CinA family nicotinamide mononucleotide deamidase-related protein [Desulfobacterales bacterium]